MIILDTNVVSELMRPIPSEVVRAWLSNQPSETLFTTTITQAEILYGVALLPESHRRTMLLAAAEQMFAIDFADRVLPFDGSAAKAYAKLAADRRREGRPAGALDVQVAAIAQACGASVATRNVTDFLGYGPTIIDPWA
ncbi:type II toxin-antitoxin system VapC family toxin [Phenylobacterium sp.]|uniref:type II toxin-antitoxin system VapC family toxin n=1 Tax=Phenylobacterium sp. TaxID=1871053 RepID=UPI002720A909|nr:type II toxin-antitoxin system VapC family toxin [Phenylobacterium sp.]MDO8802594.1 type II toxin-antitoxin system VapC family toxin [Phenylobacterium sp.]